MDKKKLDILFYTRDPGGTNAIVPLFFVLKKQYEVVAYGKDFAIQIYNDEGLKCNNILDEVEFFDLAELTRFVIEKSPKLVITGTSTIDRSEYLLWQACAKLGITTFAYVDSWAFYNARFSDRGIRGNSSRKENKYVFPDFILAVDELAKKEMVSDGIEESKIKIAGYWHFLHIRNKFQQLMVSNSVAEYKSNISENSNKKLILFVSEGFSALFGENTEEGYGYNENTIFEAFSDSLMKLPQEYKTNFCVVVRPHPKESMERWEERARSSCIPIIIDPITQLEVQLCAADLVVGMQTQCLNDAALANKKVLSIQIGLNKENPLYVSKNHFVRTALTNDELEDALNDFFCGRLKETEFVPSKKETVDFITFIQEVLKCQN